jgi:hypothetical protein
MLNRKTCVMTFVPDPLTAARAEALFTSPLSVTSQPDPGEVAAAIRTAVRAHGGTRGCAVEVAGEYGEHPETAAPRMRWARQLVEATYLPRAQTGPCPTPVPGPSQYTYTRLSSSPASAGQSATNLHPTGAVVSRRHRLLVGSTG